MQAYKMVQWIEVLDTGPNTWVQPPDPTRWQERAVFLPPHNCAPLHSHVYTITHIITHNTHTHKRVFG